MRKQIRGAILRVINAKYSIASWLWVIVSAITAAILFQLISGVADPGINQFTSALPLIDGRVWAGSLFVSSLVVLVGMMKEWHHWIRAGAMSSFIFWTFGAIAFMLLGRGATVIILIGPLMAFFAYMFIASIVRYRSQL